MDVPASAPPPLSALANAGLISHVLAFPDQDDSDTTIDEMALLDIIEAHVSDPVIRLGLGKYGVFCDDTTAEALSADLRGQVDYASFTLEPQSVTTPDAPAAGSTTSGDTPDAVTEAVRQIANDIAALREEMHTNDGPAPHSPPPSLDAIATAVSARMDRNLDALQGTLLERVAALEARLISTENKVDAIDSPSDAAPSANEQGTWQPLLTSLADQLTGIDAQVKALAVRTPSDDEVLTQLTALTEKVTHLGAATTDDAMPEGVQSLLQAVERRLSEDGSGNHTLAAGIDQISKGVADLREVTQTISTSLQSVTSTQDLGAVQSEVVAALSALSSSNDAPDADFAGLEAKFDNLQNSIAAVQSPAPLLARIAEQVDSLAGSIADPASPEGDVVGALNSINGRLEALTAKVTQAPDTEAERRALSRAAAALDHVMSRLDRESSAMGEQVEGILTGLATQVGDAARTLTSKAADLDTATLPAIAEDVAAVKANLDQGPAAIEAVEARLTSMIAEKTAAIVDQLAARPVARGGLDEQRNFTRMSVALQTMLRRLDDQIIRLEEAAPPTSSHLDLAPLQQTLASWLSENLSDLPDKSTFAALEDSIATRVAQAASARSPAGIAELHRYSTALQGMLRRIEAQVDRMEAANSATDAESDLPQALKAWFADASADLADKSSLASLEDRIVEKITKSAPSARTPDGIADLHRFSAAFQGVLRRLDNQVAQFEAGATGAKRLTDAMADTVDTVQNQRPAKGSGNTELRTMLAEVIAQLEMDRTGARLD